MKTVGYATTAVAIALSITLSLLAHRSIEEYALVGTGETFRAALGFLLAAAFFIGVAVSSIIITILAKHMRPSKMSEPFARRKPFLKSEF